MSFRELVRKPSAVLPPVISLAAFAFVLGYVAIFGVVDQDPQGDEGAPARLFQLLMAVQFLIMAFFGIKWLPQAFRPAMLVLALQIGAAVLPIATIIILES